MQTGTCLTIDAAIWVMPLCGSGIIPEVCLETFTKASCYPYCLGVRQTGSYNSIVTLYNARDWLDRVHIFNRDCALYGYTDAQQEGVSVSGTKEYDFGNDALQGLQNKLNYGSLASNLNNFQQQQQQLPSSSIATTTTTLPSPYILPGILFSSNNNNNQCVYHRFARSTLPSTTDYGATTFKTTLAPEQPFVFAGDTILTSQCDAISSNYTAQRCRVKVHRIYGTDGNQMTLVSV
jgi:hypothetical protein